MAASVFSGCATLSVCLPLKKSDVDVHDFGCSVLAYIAKNKRKLEITDSLSLSVLSALARGNSQLVYISA